MAQGKFGTAINCIDGRVQLPLIKWVMENYKLDYVDMVTKPGADLVVSDPYHKKIESVKSRVEISIAKHNSRIIFIAGHYDCAANPVSKAEHFEQIKKAIKTIKSWNFSSVDKIIGVWINEQWQVEKIAEE